MAPLSTQPFESPENRARRRLRIVQYQADIAYFQARLGLIGEPGTLNQAAQRRTFKILHKTMGNNLAQVSKTGGLPLRG